MAEQPKKEYKLSDKQRLRAKEAKRRYRLKGKKCYRCNRQAYTEILATGQLVCAIHMVNPLKEELIRLNPPKPKEETVTSQQQSVPSVSNQVTESSVQAASN